MSGAATERTPAEGEPESMTCIGANRDGRCRVVMFSGRDRVAEVVEDLFHKRWQWAECFASTDDDCALLGEITHHPDSGRRIWWAES